MPEALRVLVLGLDGLDPRLFARFASEGLLPHLTRLQQSGAWGQLVPTFPPVSPVVWTSFLTGLRPAAHGILDFVTKAPGETRATIGLYEVTAGSDGLFQYRSRRTAPTLFQLLPPGNDFCLWLPATFPAESPPGRMLSGLGAPDLLATLGTSAFYTTHPDQHASSEPGYVHALSRSADGWHGEVQGPAGGHLPFSLRRTREGLILQVSGCSSCLVSHGEWTPWLEPRFPLPASLARGLCRFKLLRSNEEFAVYRTPVWCHPSDPVYPLSRPSGFGGVLAAETGPFPTAGFGGDQLAMREGLIDRATYLEDAYALWDSQAAIARHVVSERGWRLGVIHFMVADGLQHLFWRDFDPSHPAYDPLQSVHWRREIERGYRWLDGLVGELAALAGPDTALVVVSDHGVVPLNRRVDVNGWLYQRGYITLRGDEVDWAASKAVAFGHGSIWLNLEGREPWGSVAQANYETLRGELVAALEAWRDPESNSAIMQGAWRWAKAPATESSSVSTPDIGFALVPGYGLERANLMGRLGDGVALIRPNLGTWSGGHEGPYRPLDVPGLIILSGPGISPGRELQGARMLDVAPTLLDMVGTGAPHPSDGLSLLR